MEMSLELFAILDNPTLLFIDVHLPSFTPGSPEHDLLALFAYGTWSDYIKLEPSLPPALKLDPSGNAAKKLKKLTLLTIFSNPRNVFSFDALLTDLQLDNFVDLETLIIDLLGLDHLQAKIDEQSKTVIVTRVASRCVKNEFPSIMAVVGKIRGIRGGIKRALDVSNAGD
jgi:hypothetical protein